VIEQAVHDVGLVLHAVVRHFAFAIGADDEQHWRLPMLDLGRHLDIRLCAIVKDAARTNVVVATLDSVIEIQFVGS
jgi:hypothetical protein